MDSSIQEKKTIFIHCLRDYYRQLYNNIKPKPDGTHSEIRSVKQAYVDCKLEIYSTELTSVERTQKLYQSFYELCSDDSIKYSKSTIEGDPGYGKSMLGIRIAHDWCEGEGHPRLNDVDILIYLRMRQLREVRSLQQAIKQHLLPETCTLKMEDIKQVISESSSIMILFDGYDEYPGKERHPNLLTRTQVEMSSGLQEITLTRTSVLPEDSSSSVRIRLIGFDSVAQEKYLRKVVVSSQEDEVQRIIACLNYENASLQDLCKVPMFYSIFSHWTHDNRELKTCESVSKFFRCLIEGMESHLKNKIGDEQLVQLELTESHHRALGKIAFAYIYDDKEDLIDIETFKQLPSDGCLEQYIRLGILLRCTSGSNHKIKFNHRVFCEWYAAYYLAAVMASPDDSDLNLRDFSVDDPEELLYNMVPSDAPYLIQFACSMDPIAADKIISWLKINNDYDTFSVLCFLEQHGPLKLEPVQEICSDVCQVRKVDQTLAQKSSIKLLVIAADYNVPIKQLLINDCYNSIDRDKGEIVLSSDRRIPVLSTLEELCLDERKKIYTVQEMDDIIYFASKCQNLTVLKFDFCLLPESYDLSTLETFQSRNVEVLWCGVGTWHRLDLVTGRWKTKDAGNDIDYSREVKLFTDFFGWESSEVRQ